MSAAEADAVKGEEPVAERARLRPATNEKILLAPGNLTALSRQVLTWLELLRGSEFSQARLFEFASASASFRQTRIFSPASAIAPVRNSSSTLFLPGDFVAFGFGVGDLSVSSS